MGALTGMILDIHFTDARTGFIAGASASDEGRPHARIPKTVNGGETWHPTHMGLSTNKIRFLPLPGGGTRVLALGHDLFSLDLPTETR